MATIADNLQKLRTSLENAYDAIDTMGGTVPSKLNASNLADAIESIPAGGGESKKYGVSLSAYLGNVNSSGSYGRPTVDETYKFTGVKNIDSYALAYHQARHSSDSTKKRSLTVKFPDLTSIAGSYGMYYFGYYNKDIVAIDMPSLTSTTGSYAMQYSFYNCTNLSSANLSALKSIGSYGLYYAFYGDSKLSAANYPSLTSVSTYGLDYAHYNNTALTSMCLSSLQTVGNYGLYYAFSGCSKLTNADYSSLTGITSTYGLAYTHYNNTSLTAVNLSALKTGASQGYSLRSAFYGCSKLSALDLPQLSGYAASYSMASICQNCSALLSASFGELSAVGSSTSYTYSFASAFYNCSALTAVEFPKVQFIGGNYAFSYAFYGCNSLTSISFPELTAITGATSSSYATFYSCNKLKEMFFPKLSSITNTYLFYTNCTDLTTLHFAKVNEAAITATAGYSTCWGKGAGTISCAFDLNTDGTVWDGTSDPY